MRLLLVEVFSKLVEAHFLLVALKHLVFAEFFQLGFGERRREQKCVIVDILCLNIAFTREVKCAKCLDRVPEQLRHCLAQQLLEKCRL